MNVSDRRGFIAGAVAAGLAVATGDPAAATSPDGLSPRRGSSGVPLRRWERRTGDRWEPVRFFELSVGEMYRDADDPTWENVVLSPPYKKDGDWWVASERRRVAATES